LVTACAGPAAAQTIVAKSFTTADGLPSDQVMAVAQTADGRLWVGTTRGLREFFGSQFRSEGIPDPISLSWVHALLATSDGTLWIGAGSSLHRRNPDGSWDTNLEVEAGLEVEEIAALHLAQDKALWVGGINALARLSGGVWETITIDGESPRISSLGEDAQGYVWAAVMGPTGSMIQVYDGREPIALIDADDGLPVRARFTAWLRDAAGEMWAATDAGLVQFSGFSVRRILTKEDGLANDNVWTVIRHPGGGLWAGTAGGLNRLQDGFVTSTLTSEVTGAGDSVEALAYDWEGNLWVGTNAGISRLPFGPWSTESHPLLQFTEVKDLLPGADGTSYAVTEAGVVYRTPAGEWTLLDETELGQVVYTLVRGPDGAIWAGTNSGLARLEEGRFKADTRVPRDLRVPALLFDSKGDLWAGTNEGLYRVSGGEVMLFSKASGELGQNSVLALWETATGDLWVGTLNGGARRYRDGTWTIVDRGTTGNGLINDFVIDGLEDSARNLWFATSMGVSRLQAGGDPHDSAAWRTFQIPDLSGEQVNALWEDRLRPGKIWVGTEGGLNLISGDLPPSAFTRDDGLSHKWINALDQAPDGTLWIGTRSGLTYHLDKKRAPMVELRPLLVNNEECDAACLAEGVSYDSETATFQYAASDLGDLSGLEYLVSIRAGEVLSQTQTPEGSVVQNLEPGTQYAFSVEAFDRDFNAASTLRPLELFVQSPTWWESLREKPYFPILLILAIGGLILLALRVYVVGIRWWQRRQLFTYSYDLVVSPRSREKDPPLEVLVMGEVRWPTRLNKILARLHVPSELVRLFTGQIESLNREAFSKPNLGRIQRLEAELREHRADAPGTLQDLGSLLYRALFPDLIAKDLRKLDLGDPNLSARLRLRQGGAPHLKAVPWEFMYDPGQPGYLTIDSQVTLVHDLSVEGETYELDDRAGLRVLVALSNPEAEHLGLSRLTRQKDELRAIEGALASLTEDGRAEVLPLWNVQWSQFVSAVSKGGWDVIHFTGHSGIWEDQDLPVLFFDNGKGVPIRIPHDEFVKLFHGASTAKAGRPKLVVLNACRTAQQNVIEDTLGLAEALVQVARLPACIGMGYEISEDAAVDFCREFYGTLVDHGQVDHAVMVARGVLADKLGRGRLHWGAPRLYSRVRDGVLFGPDKLRSKTDEPDSRE